jgi:hypothetical protein
MKRYVIAMSVTRKRAIWRMEAYADTLMEHIIKLVTYSDIRPNDVSGWLHTVARCLHEGDEITVKPDSRKMTEEELEDSLFCAMGTSLNDYKGELALFQENNRKGKYNHDGKESYPSVEPDEESAKILMDICHEIMERTMPLLLDKQNHSIEEYENAIRDLFE